MTWDCARELPQEAYLRACRAFNDDATMRTCKDSGAVLPPIDLAPFYWADVAAEVREAEAAESARAQKGRARGKVGWNHDRAAPRRQGAAARQCL